MLTHLQIRDFAIVESVELELSPGFTALTGETGAGKSILVDALLLAVGGRADSGAVRHGAERAEVTASFDLARNARAAAWLGEQSIEHEGEVVLRRVVSADGRSRAYINGRTMPVQSLRAIGEHLVDVHGQLEFQSLARRGYQRELLDDSGGLAKAVEAVRSTCRAWRARCRAAGFRATRATATVVSTCLPITSRSSTRSTPDLMSAELAEERRRIASLGRLAEGTAQVEGLLAGDEGGASAALARSQSLLRQLANLDPSLAPTEQLLDEAAIACREAVASLRRYAQSLDADPARQDWVESRLAALEDTARKHRVEVGGLPELRQRLTDELAALQAAATSLADLDRKLAAAAGHYRSAAAHLSGARRDAAAALDKKVTALMQGLGMPGGVLATSIESPEALQFAEHGNDDVEFR
jgi:DNA repair protein RecN (Recombination protein N)